MKTKFTELLEKASITKNTELFCNINNNTAICLNRQSLPDMSEYCEDSNNLIKSTFIYILNRFNYSFENSNLGKYQVNRALVEFFYRTTPKTEIEFCEFLIGNQEIFISLLEKDTGTLKYTHFVTQEDILPFVKENNAAA